MRGIKLTTTVANGQQVSSGWTQAKSTIFTMIHLPIAEDGTVTLEMTIDNGVSWNSVLGDDGQSLTVVSSGYDPGWRDISDYIRAVPADVGAQLRLNLGAVQSAERTITILQRG